MGGDKDSKEEEEKIEPSGLPVHPPAGVTFIF